MLTPDVYNPVVGISLAIAATMLAASMVCAVWRVLRGPSVPDRVISIDLLGYYAVSTIALYSIAVGKPVLLSVAIVMALVLFLGTAAFATYLERRARP